MQKEGKRKEDSMDTNDHHDGQNDNGYGDTNHTVGALHSGCPVWLLAAAM